MTERLRDGTTVEIAPAGADVRDRVLQIFDGLDEDSRYQRFLGITPKLGGRALDLLTDIDHRDHEAVVAVDPESDRGVGLARFRRRPGDTEAEVAVSVVDDWQGRGLGTVLLHRLVERARAAGVQHIRAYMLASNRDMLALMRSVGPLEEVERDGTTLEVRLPIRTEVPRERLTRWLREASQGALESTLAAERFTRRGVRAATGRGGGSARPDSAR